MLISFFKTTKLKAPEISKESREATNFLDLKVSLIYKIKRSKADSVNLSLLKPICSLRSKENYSATSLILFVVTVSKSLPSVESRVIGLYTLAKL